MNGTDKSRRFCILHCDQAIELILKEKMRALGESIFKNHGRTIDFHESLDKLANQKGVKIPESPNLELLHDLRNVIQHKGATVSKDETEFYIKVGYEFIKRFTKDELGIEIKQYLDKRYYELFEPKTKVEGQIPRPIEEVTEESAGVALLSAYADLEVAMIRTAMKAGLIAPSSIQEAIKFLENNNFLSKSDMDKLNVIRRARNEYAHSMGVPTVTEARYTIAMAKDLERKIIEHSK